MENEDPGTGDTRYVPVSWLIAETREWDSAPYTATFRVSKAGTYTLTVTYQQQEYDGSSWVDTGVQDTKSVTFTVSAASVTATPTASPTPTPTTAVATGDTTSILPLVVILILAAVCIVGIVFYRKKKNQ